MLDFILSELQRGIIGELVIIFVFLRALFFFFRLGEAVLETKRQNALLRKLAPVVMANTMDNFNRYSCGIPEHQYNAYMHRVKMDAMQ